MQSSTTAVSYTYDNAGNLITDSQKQMTLAYNALNLPDVFTFTSVNPNNRIEIGYDAGGMKLEKQAFTGLTLSLHKRYVGGIYHAQRPPGQQPGLLCSQWHGHASAACKPLRGEAVPSLPHPTLKLAHFFPADQGFFVAGGFEAQEQAVAKVFVDFIHCGN